MSAEYIYIEYSIEFQPHVFDPPVGVLVIYYPVKRRGVIPVTYPSVSETNNAVPKSTFQFIFGAFQIK